MTTRPVPVIAIHGGAGSRGPGEFDPNIETAYRDALAEVLRAGRQLLADGGNALDAVSLAVDLLEDCPLFNAGHGAVFTRDGTHELDAAVMDGATLRAGAVACVSRIRRPLRAARAVMEHSKHVLLVGAGAEAFAEAFGLELVEPEYFSTELRREQLRRAQAPALLVPGQGAAVSPLDDELKHGTVGAVALDARGHLAAATSTGGVTNKLPGRVGDLPLIGAGTYANRVAAISCTGTGEYFIRYAVAHDVCARIAYGGLTLQAATEHVVMEVLPAIGGAGGLIAVDAYGNVSLPFNTEGMYRGYMRADDPAPWTACLAD
ncbi:MAG TPA: isoaspartyl peptidase/L-asparaginase [Aromatoleum sp.]|uniref:isoaspartyl peptidase/L-asparaginase family protein n=1 Tax=Aromatoleum sp. TaxID=2307007 RepID=UPI002B4A4CD0|nr:isoaspartyl peptidase/L-asparaginase [Aromatoleum sp.]HJV25997.1 isoaspartyl peptidase/L-asparaginase [Aromatoleum sp.]